MNYKEKVLYKALCSRNPAKIASACWHVNAIIFDEGHKGYAVLNTVIFPVVWLYAMYSSLKVTPTKKQMVENYIQDNDDDVIGFKLLTYYEGD